MIYAPSWVGIGLSSLLIKLPSDEAILLVKKDITFALCHSPWEVQERLVNWIAAMSLSNIEALLGDESLIFLIRSQYCLTLIKALQKISPEFLLKYFYCAFDKKYNALTSIFAHRKIDSFVAMELMNLAEKLNNKNLFQIFESKKYVNDKGILSSFEGNLLYILFRNADPLIVKKALNSVKRFKNNEIEYLFNSVGLDAEGNPPTALGQALIRPDVASIFIDFLESRPNLKSLFIKTSFFRPVIPIYNAFKYQNIELIAYFLIHRDFFSKYQEKFSWILERHKNEAIFKLFEALSIKHEDIYDNQQLIRAIIPQLKKNSFLLRTTWFNKKTLLHFAASTGDSALIFQLVSLGQKSLQ